METKRHRTAQAIIAVLVLLSIVFPVPLAQAVEPDTTIYFFWGHGCPYCEVESNFLKQIETKYPHVRVASYEVWYNQENRALLMAMAQAKDMEVRGVPVTFIGDKVWIGFNQKIEADIERTIVSCSTADCPDPLTRLLERVAPVMDEENHDLKAEAPIEAVDGVLTLPIVGDIDLAGSSLVLSTALIAFVDGMNPCSLWVLSLLLAMVIHARSRKKLVIVGITFLTITSLVYGGFIVGLFSAFQVVGYADWVRMTLSLITLIIAIISIKDFFRFKQGVSLTISDRHKPKIYEKMRHIMRADTVSKTFILTAVMAFGIAFIELPCTAGFPVAWTNMISARGVHGLHFWLLLFLYLLIYLLDEMAIFLAASVTLRVTKLNERHGRLLKLSGGVIMLYLSLTLLFWPEMMWEMAGALQIFALAALTIAIIVLVHKRRSKHAVRDSDR